MGANLGEDADMTAAITGQVAGFYGEERIPVRRLDKLVLRAVITDLADGLRPFPESR